MDWDIIFLQRYLVLELDLAIGTVLSETESIEGLGYDYLLHRRRL